jgi:hypothetical protein
VKGHYEVRDSPINGLAAIVWKEPGARVSTDGAAINIGTDRLPLLHAALGEYLNQRAILDAEAKADAAAQVTELAARRRAKGGQP